MTALPLVTLTFVIVLVVTFDLGWRFYVEKAAR